MANDWLSMTWGKTLEEDIELLLSDLCVGWGFCNHIVSGERLLDEGGGVVTASDVAQATMDAEGETDPARRRAIERLFAYRYGTTSISRIDHAPDARGPYAVVPPRSEMDSEPADAVLDEARALVSGSAPAITPSLSVEAVTRSIKALRRRTRFVLGQEEHAAVQNDWTALIVLHEQLSGEYWISDPEGRRRLGLSDQPGRRATT
jgi:hypothetical protein